MTGFQEGRKMKLCDTCTYGDKTEYFKPCIIYRDDCEYYEREDYVKAIIQIDVPDHQIGQEVSIYFKDTMMIKGIVQESSDDLISRRAVVDVLTKNRVHFCDMTRITSELWELPSFNLQEPKTGHWTIGHDENGRRIIACDFCGRVVPDMEPYCMSCGRRMLKPKEESK